MPKIRMMNRRWPTLGTFLSIHQGKSMPTDSKRLSGWRSLRNLCRKTPLSPKSNVRGNQFKDNRQPDGIVLWG